MEIKILIKTFLKKKQILKKNKFLKEKVFCLIYLNFRLALKIINQVSNFATV